MNEEQIEKLILTLEGINKSLRSLAKDAKANKKLKTEINSKLTDLESSLESLKKDPFGLNERD